MTYRSIWAPVRTRGVMLLLAGLLALLVAPGVARAAEVSCIWCLESASSHTWMYTADPGEANALSVIPRGPHPTSSGRYVWEFHDPGASSIREASTSDRRWPCEPVAANRLRCTTYENILLVAELGDGDDRHEPWPARLATRAVVGGPGDDVLAASPVVGEQLSELRGGDGADLLVGAAHEDEIDGGAGDDRIFSAGGDDRIFDPGGVNKVDAGDGDDEVTITGGRATVSAGAGHDRVQTAEGGDAIAGGPGFDWLAGGAGDDVIEGEAGGDAVFGGDGADTIRTGEGDDVVLGDDTFSRSNRRVVAAAPGSDTIHGEAGSDALYGDGGNDAIYGAAGWDWVHGDAGDDRLYGHGDMDWVAGGAGNDRMYGGGGNDALGERPDRRRWDLNRRTIEAGNDVLVAGAGNDGLFGGAGRDSYSAGRGKDRLATADGRREGVRCGGGRDRYTADRGDRRKGCERAEGAEHDQGKWFQFLAAVENSDRSPGRGAGMSPEDYAD